MDYIYGKSNGKPTTIEKLVTTLNPNGKIESVREIKRFLEGFSDADRLKDILSAITALIPDEDSSRNFAAIMSLATDPNAGVTISTTNPEWKLVLTDANDAILLGKKQDNTWYFATDLDTILDAIISGYTTTP